MPVSTRSRPRTAWRDRVSVLASAAGVSVEGLGSLVESELSRVDSVLFTATPTEDLDDISRWQRLADAAWCGQVRAVVAAWNRADVCEREFLACEVSLALAVTDATAQDLVCTALMVAELPGLLEAVEVGMLTVRHAFAVTSALSRCGLMLDGQIAVVLLALARYAGETPGELGRLVERLAHRYDPSLGQRREETARRMRGVRAFAVDAAEGMVVANGPLAMIEDIRAALAAGAAQPAGPDDDRTREQREFDLMHQLVTGGVSPAGQPLFAQDAETGSALAGDSGAAHPGHTAGLGSRHGVVVVPYSTAAGGDLELGEVPGLGPVLPGTARELLARCDTVTRVAVDGHGRVLEVSPVLPGPAAASTDADPQRWLRDLIAGPVVHGPPTATAAYRPGPVMRRYVQASNRTCSFPHCNRPAADSDLDHRLAWPNGPTDPENLHPLCRRHHRAKQAVFTVIRLEDGTTRWITRGGWWFDRPPAHY